MMTRTILRRTAASALVLLVAGCGLLDVSDPTTIEERDLSNATGAELLRGAAIRQLSIAVGSAAYFGGVLADEFFSDPPAFNQQSGIVWPDAVLDRRESVPYEQLGTAANNSTYRFWQEERRAATVAIPALRAYALPGAAEAHVGEMFALRAFAELRLAEDYCPGFPLHRIVDLKPVYGPPLSTDKAFEQALADFDSALVYAADSARVVNLATVGRARTLVGLGRFTEASAAVSQVPTDYVATVEYLQSVFGLRNPLYFAPLGLNRSVADQEGGTGLDFISASDPRVQTVLAGTAVDGVAGIYHIAKYPDGNAPIVLASGIEARLIEAEAALNAGDPNWLTILNSLRSTQITPGLPALSDPGSFDAQVDLLFRERAFWLFATGHRLADLRRLIRHYGRSSESVFPTAAYRLGGTYGTGTSVPFPAALETPFNPAVTGCTSR